MYLFAFGFFSIYLQKSVLHSTFLEILKREGLLIMLQLLCALSNNGIPPNNSGETPREILNFAWPMFFHISTFFPPVGSIFVIVPKICKSLMHLYKVTTNFVWKILHDTFLKKMCNNGKSSMQHWISQNAIFKVIFISKPNTFFNNFCSNYQFGLQKTFKIAPSIYFKRIVIRNIPICFTKIRHLL